jgi:hypothetical protein
MLITKEVEIELSSSQIKYYSNLGYCIPKTKDKYGRYTTPKGTKLIVKIEDLQKGSHVDIQYKCDLCGEIITCEYKTYILSQINSYTKIDVCNNCRVIKAKMSIKEKYGVDNLLMLPEIREKSYDKNRKSYEFIHNEFDKLGYILITPDYQNNKQPLDYICKKHLEYGIQTTNYANIQHHGSACKLCANERMSNLKKNSFEDVKNEYFNLGYNLLSNEDEYIDCHTALKCSCQKHPNEIFNVNLVGARKHQGCKKCFQEKISRENHFNWKGGITSLSNYLRDKIKPWVLDSLRNNNFKCVITNVGNHKLVVHHLYSFANIINETLINLNLPIYDSINKYSEEDLENLKNLCLELHYKYGLGVSLTKEIHDLFHKIYGSKNNTLFQFHEFQNKIKSGEIVI